MMSGANYHISYCQILESERRLKVSTILNVFSNRHSNDLTLSDFISSFSTTPDVTASDTSIDIDIYSTVLFSLSDISLDTATLQYLAFIGSYSVHQLWKHTPISSECIMCLTEDKYLHLDEPPDSKYKILEFTDRGNLK